MEQIARSNGYYDSDLAVLAEWDSFIGLVATANSISAEVGVPISYRHLIAAANNPGATTIASITEEIRLVQSGANRLTNKNLATRVAAGVGLFLGVALAVSISDDGTISDVAPPASDPSDGGDFDPLYRESKTGTAALSASSYRSRSILGIQDLTKNDPRNFWVAHHLLPFISFQRMYDLEFLNAISQSGFLLDSAENLIALPGNQETFMSNGQVLPYHTGPHGNYIAAVNAEVEIVRQNWHAGAYSASGQLATALYEVSGTFRGQIESRFWHNGVH